MKTTNGPEILAIPQVDLANMYHKGVIEPPLSPSADDDRIYTTNNKRISEHTKTRKEIGKASRTTWNEFMSTTTFHGCRYIFSNSEYKIRKIVWLICVCTALGLFSYQVVSRTMAYFDYESNVNVEVVYPSNVTFPAVTLCNQNNFRISALVESRMEKFIQSSFLPSVRGRIEENRVTLPNSSLLEHFIVNTAHQKNDMIESCMWQGVPCNQSDSFVSKLTGFGMCFTFNSEGMATDLTGSAHGLTLVLNIEQYEYSWGPHNEAGLKILLHDASEYPLVGDLGFSVAPGTQTLVAIQRQEVHSQPSPYGNCDPIAPPRPNCILQCQTEHAVFSCGCRDVFMPPVSNGSVCDIETAFACIKELKAYHDIKCSCSTPCRKTVFTQELSYAQLSSSSVDTLLPQDEFKFERLQRKYIHARETSHHMHNVFIRNDKRKFEPVKVNLEDYVTAVNASLSILESGAAPGNRKGVELSTVERVKFLYDDTREITKRMRLLSFKFAHGYIDAGFHSWFRYKDAVKELKYRFLSSYGTHLWCSSLEIRGAECASTLVGPYSVSMLNSRIQNAIDAFRAINPEYLDHLSKIYLGILSYDEIMMKDDVKMCMEELQNLSAFWVDTFLEIQNSLENYTQSSSWSDRLEAMTNVKSLANTTLTLDEFLLKREFIECDWYVRKDIPNVNEIGLVEQKASAAKTRLISALPTAASKGKDLFRFLKVQTEFLYAPFMEYLKNNTDTKIALSKIMKSSEYRVQWENLQASHALYVSELKTVVTAYAELTNSLLATVNYFSHGIVKKSFKIETLNLILLAKRANKTIETYDNDNYTRVFIMLVDLVSKTYEDHIRQSYTTLSQIFRDLVDAMSVADEYLDEFIEGNELNKEFVMQNFIKLDIFYKEISYDKVIQRPAFQFLSLLGEVGGFLGLLLGASVLTVCELVDYLTMACLGKCKISGKISSIKE